MRKQLYDELDKGNEARLGSVGRRDASENEADDFGPRFKKTSLPSPKSRPSDSGSVVAAAGAGAEKQPGPPKAKPKSASTGSTREYPKPKARPSGSDDRASPFKERDEGMVNYSKRFEGSDHG